MKIARFYHEGLPHDGVVEEGYIRSTTRPGLEVPSGECELTVPVYPSKVVCVGLNYRDHAEEMGLSQPDEPVIFLKPSTAVIGPGDDIVYPRSAVRVDHESELAVVIKRHTRKVALSAVPDHVAGFTCLNDVTERDLQKKDGQWTRAKSFDSFAPIGPWIETDLDTSDLKVQCYVNGELRQSSSTRELLFDISYLDSFISSIMTLLPGDVIATGTPAGIGPVRPGDTVVVKIDGIGSLVNMVVREKICSRDEKGNECE